MERRARPSTVIRHHSTICMALTLTTLWCFNTMIKAHSSAVRALRCYLINNPIAKKYHHSSYWAPSRFWVVHQQISVSTIMPLAHLLPKYINIHLESNLSLKFHVPQPWPRDCGHIGWLDLGRWDPRSDGRSWTKAHSVTFGVEKKCQKNLPSLKLTVRN